MPQIMSALTQPSSGSPKWWFILPAFALLYFAVLLVQNWLQGSQRRRPSFSILGWFS